MPSIIIQRRILFGGRKALASTYTNSSGGTYWDKAGVLQTAAIDTKRFDHDPTMGNISLGLIYEGAATQECPNPRDLTQAAWVKTNITAAKDVTGVDGTANSASTLTATAANGTCLDAVTLSAADFTFSARVRRKTGIGRVDITIDGGTTWNEITGEISTGQWERPLVSKVAANPSMGFRLVVDTDVIEVDCCQLEAGPHPTSEILTGAVVRATDILTYPRVEGGTGWVFNEPAAMATADGRWLRDEETRFTKIGAGTADVSVFWLDPADNSDRQTVMANEALT